jgi:hypothetical protein
MADTLAGDIIASGPPCAIDPPAPPRHERGDIELVGRIPRHLPDAKKAELKRTLREKQRIIRERAAAALEPEFARTKEVAAELEQRKEELANKPKKEKEDYLMKFIPDEPEYRVDQVPDSLTNAPADQRPFSRLQRSFEQRRKVGLHE